MQKRKAHVPQAVCLQIRDSRCISMMSKCRQAGHLSRRDEMEGSICQFVGDAPSRTKRAAARSPGNALTRSASESLLSGLVTSTGVFPFFSIRRIPKGAHHLIGTSLSKAIQVGAGCAQLQIPTLIALPGQVLPAGLRPIKVVVHLDLATILPSGAASSAGFTSPICRALPPSPGVSFPDAPVEPRSPV
jgi:hypothetical protein